MNTKELKVTEDYELYKKWCESNNRPVRSYTAFMHFREYKDSQSKLTQPQQTVSDGEIRMKAEKYFMENIKPLHDAFDSMDMVYGVMMEKEIDAIANLMRDKLQAQTNEGWIDLKKDKPKEKTNIIVCTQGGTVMPDSLIIYSEETQLKESVTNGVYEEKIISMRFEYNGFFQHFFHNGIFVGKDGSGNEITHWMPLPKSPTKH